MSSLKEEIKSGFTVRAIVVALILSIIGFFANTFTWWGNGISLEPVFAGRVGSAIVPPYGLMFLLTLASVLLGSSGFTLPEITVITVISFINADAPFTVGAFLQYIFAGTYLTTTRTDLAALLNYYPSGLWTPGNVALVSPAWAGNASAPWGALLPYLLFWGFVLMLWGLTMVFEGAVLRNQLIKKEKLPFPAFLPLSELGAQHAKGGFMSYIKKTTFLAGLLIGLVAGGISALNYIYKFTTVFFAFGQFALNPVNDFFLALSQRTIYGWWQFIPSDVAILYLAPMNVLLSIVIVDFLGLILLPFLLLYTGMITPGTNASGAGPFPTTPFMYNWVPLALGFWMIVMAYKYYGASISNALKRVAANPGELSEVFTWGGLAVTWLLWILLWTFLGANPILTIFMVLVNFLYIAGMVAVHGYTGTWVAGGNAGMVRPATWALGSAMGTFPSTGAAARTQSAWATMAALGVTTYQGGVIQQGTQATWAFTGSYSLSGPTKTREKDILLAQIAALLMTALIAMPLGVMISYGTGISKLKAWGLGSAGAISPWQTQYVVVDAAPPSSLFWTQGVIAFVLVGALMFLRSSYAWFFFNPYALFFYSTMWLLNGSIAWVLKLITLRLFGAKTYEEVGVPVAVGFLVGLTLAATLIMGIAAFTTSAISVGPTGY